MRLPPGNMCPAEESGLKARNPAALDIGVAYTVCDS